MYFYAKVLVDGRVRLSREEMNDVYLNSLEELGVWLDTYCSESAQLIWGAGFGAEDGADTPDYLPLPDLNECSKNVLYAARECWEFAANHPETTGWATPTYYQMAAKYGERFGKATV